MKKERQAPQSSVLAQIERWSLPGAVVSLGVFIAFVLTDHPHRAVWWLAGVMALAALLRFVLPGRPWFASRGRIFDSILFALVAIGLGWFAPWTATIG